MSEETLSLLIAGFVAIPVSGALLCFLLPLRYRPMLGIAFSVLTSATVIYGALWVTALGSRHHELGGWPAPLGIHLTLDGLSGVFLLMTALVALPSSLYSRYFFRLTEEQTGAHELFWPVWLFLWGGMNGLYLSADLFNLYVVIEIVGLAAVTLAILSGKAAALLAGLRYLLAAITGSMAYLMGVALIYGSVGVLDFTLVGEAIQNDLNTHMAFGLMIAGLMVKTAVFPLHFWLPPAHSNAQSPVSAILSALVVKCTFYVLLRLWVDVLNVSVSYAGGQLLGVLGSIAILWGSYQALRQSRLKLIIAHSTVGQIGFMFLLFPLITIGPEDADHAPWLTHAWTGGIYQALAHAFAKSALFLAAGIYIIAVGNDRKESMANLVRHLPMTTFTIALAGVSLIGLPPSGGFVAKWMLLKAALSSGQWWWAPVIVVGGFLTAGYVFMILRQAFVPSKQHVSLQPVPRAMELTALLLGIGAIVIGFRAEEILMLLDIDTPFEEPAAPEEENAAGNSENGSAGSIKFRDGAYE